LKTPYKLNNKELVELKKQLKKLIARRCICHNKWPYEAPILFVDKKNGKLCICVVLGLGFTIKKNDPFPQIDDVFD